MILIVLDFSKNLVSNNVLLLNNTLTVFGWFGGSQYFAPDKEGSSFNYLGFL